MNEASQDKTLDLFPIDYPFETLVGRISKNPPSTVLNPEFQRKYKWDKEGWGRASKFIESCLMRIPLPSCYFAEDESGRHLVIDGVQRLTTIKKFFDDEFALEGLTAFKELEGKRFSEIGSLKAELETTTIRCIVLRKGNPKKLIREIFSRLNQGAVSLSAQEIRHAIYPGNLDDLLMELSGERAISSFGLPNSSDRLKDSREGEEQVLRFFAFNNDPDLITYEDNLSDFLDKYMENNQEISKVLAEKLKQLFLKAMNNCIEIFGDDVFSNPTRERAKQGLVYYDLLMPAIANLKDSIVTSKKNEISKAFTLLCQSAEFERTLSSGTQKKSSILRRKKLWLEILEKTINE